MLDTVDPPSHRCVQNFYGTHVCKVPWCFNRPWTLRFETSLLIPSPKFKSLLVYSICIHMASYWSHLLLELYVYHVLLWFLYYFLKILKCCLRRFLNYYLRVFIASSNRLKALLISLKHFTVSSIYVYTSWPLILDRMTFWFFIVSQESKSWKPWSNL